MNEELKLILYSFRQRMRFGNGNADNLCEIITNKPMIDNEGDTVHSCAYVKCDNCIIYPSTKYHEMIIHVWNQL